MSGPTALPPPPPPPGHDAGRGGRDVHPAGKRTGGIRAAGARAAGVRARASQRGFQRSREGRVIAGVAAGLGVRLGVDPVLVRIGFAVLSFAGGFGLLVYGLLWAFTPAGDVRPARRPVTAQQGVALALIVLGVLLMLRNLGVWFGDAIAGPLVLAAAGSAVLWARSDEDTRASWQRITGRDVAVSRAASAPVSPIRVVAGTLLVGGAAVGFVAANEAVTAARELLVALMAAAIGVGLLFGPWLWRLIEELGTERSERVRQEERAELAAHLHDSVLQTLALIQRSSDQPRRMVTLARRQERELRAWLYGAGAPGTEPSTTLASALAELTEEVETTHAITVEVVTVGDTALTEPVAALVAATREACVNAAKHSEVELVDVYVEVAGDEVLAFIRDRGVGFDPDQIAGDRQGIRRSIVARLERHDGAAQIFSTPGEGTEVELSVPRKRRRRQGGSNGATNGSNGAAGAAGAHPSSGASNTAGPRNTDGTNGNADSRQR